MLERMMKRMNTCIFHHKRLTNIIIPCRQSSLGLWKEDLNTEIKLRIEKRWGQDVRKQNTDINHENTKPFYVLAMFPYPSGNLHMGHVRVYSLSDTIARFHRLNGAKVLHPIGWDSFGLPAENAAIERKIPPKLWTTTNIEEMKKQLLALGLNFDWDREFSTSDPEYYKWTQYIFLKLFENKLAYQKEAVVNWDPVDKTVLADEQVDDHGCSWRSGAKVEKKLLTQWFLKATKFSQKLYEGLDSPCLENWKDIINLQKHWIGECNGIDVTFKIKIDNIIREIDVWSVDPYKFLHGQFLVMSKENLIIKDLIQSENVSMKAINPITGSEMPVIISDAISFPEGRDVYIACPSICNEDENIAVSLNVPILVKHENIDIQKENEAAISIARQKNVGGHFVSSKLKDWLISRQRYWGTPIPIIHCSKCGVVPVPYEDLPVKLPENYDTSESLKSSDWVKCKCPKCESEATRETDTMDTFVDSSWYFYRFLDPKNDKMPFDHNKIVGNTPAVDIYIGGKEHAVLHFYYARFMSYFLNSIGLSPVAEPFKSLLVQGMVMGKSYKLKSSGKYIPAEKVEQDGKVYKEIGTGESVIMQWEKMSKSKYNGVNPEKILSTYGCDTTRLLIVADVSPASNRRWSDETFPGVLNWQQRLWLTMRTFLEHRNNEGLKMYDNNNEEFKKLENALWEKRNNTISRVTFHFKHTQMPSVAISTLQSLTNSLRNKLSPEFIHKSREFESTLASLIIMLAPVAPHFCSELWAGFLSAPRRVSASSSLIDWDKPVLKQSWPKVDEDYELFFFCRVDGVEKFRLKIKPRDLANLTNEDAIQMMLNEDSVKQSIKHEILKTQCEIYPGCHALLQIVTNIRKKNVKAEKVSS